MHDVASTDPWPVHLHFPFDVASARLADGVASQRRLSELRECFADEAAYERALRGGDPVVYSVSTPVVESRDGALAFGLGQVNPGRVGDEYFMTKGHFHQRRAAAEVYVGLAGTGGLVLESESGAARFVPLSSAEIVYVPGNTAHRTVNTGAEPFTYLGVYEADAGHDYAAIGQHGFSLVVVAGPDGPVPLARSGFLRTLQERVAGGASHE